jgi:hypothetical protein
VDNIVDNNVNNDINDVDNDKIYIVHKVKNNTKKYDSDELFEDEINSFTKLTKLLKSTKSTKSSILKTKSSDSIKILSSNSKIKSKTKSKLSSSETNVRNRTSSISSPDNKKLYKKIKDNNVFFNELLKKQIGGISNEKKLNYNDIKRISKLIKSSIFDKKNCSIWGGYITNENNSVKGTYINFYFNKKKIALHRLLYINYIGPLTDNEYLKFSCENKGKCCNVHHMKKYTYNNKTNKSNNSSLSNTSETTNTTNTELGYNKSSNNETTETIQINTNKDKLIVEI